MSVLVQIQNLPEATHRTLKSRASLEGRTLSDYLRRELVALAERPSPEELWQRIEGRAAVGLEQSPADTIRQERETRG